MKEKYDFDYDYITNYDVDENDLIEAILSLGSIKINDCC